MPRDPRLPPPPLTRRSLLEWLGGATVLGLTSPLLQACAGGSAGAAAEVAGEPADAPVDPGGAAEAPGEVAAETGSPDASEPGADVPAEQSAADHAPDVPADPTRLAEAACPDGQPPPAAPAMGGVFDVWSVRTVDEQVLADLIANWRLRVEGLVERPTTFTFCDLLALGLVQQVTDFHCVEGWSVYDVPWDGVPLSVLLDAVGPLPGATHLTIGCRKGIYSESLAIDVAREPRSLLGLGVDGRTLPLPHGFPARVVVPRLFGYKNAKHVESITLTDQAHVGFWPKYGYSVAGEVPPDRLREGKY